MEKLPRLRARIAALGDFHELIRALEALAATHYRAAQDALGVSARHLEIVDRACEGVTPGGFPPGTAAPIESGGSGVLIAIFSEHGFVGAFNERVLDRVAAELTNDETLIVIGRRGAQIASDRSMPTGRTFSMSAHANSVPVLARQLCVATTWANTIRIVFSRHQSDKPLFVDCQTLNRRMAAADWTFSDLDRPLHHLRLEPLQTGLRDDHIFATIAHCLLQSLASENAKRLASMQAADRNIKDKLAQLRQRERTLRQEEITEELLDILIGVQSVST